jgi:hypothetical protein
VRLHPGLGAAVLASAAVSPGALLADAVPVRFPEGVAHGFLKLSSLEGKPLADGDLIQTARGDQVTTRVVLQFRDGSLHDETVVFSQRSHFRMVRDHLVQKGPSFPRALDALVDAENGQVRFAYTDDGKEKVVSERPELPADLSNGLILVLLKNIRPETARTTVSMLAATPKPRLVKMIFTPAGDDAFEIGASRRKATHYVMKIEIGGIAGLVAPLIGKQPPDTHVWILGGDAPAFVKSEGPMYEGGPAWRLELATPSWPAPAASRRTP